MCSVTKEECDTILATYFGSSNYGKLIDYTLSTANDASIGLMSTVATLILKVHCGNNDKPEEVRCFIKFLPKNEYHLSMVTNANCFKKEAAFFGSMFSGMRKFLSYKSIPECYLKDSERIIVLADLTVSGYKNCSCFDLNHIYSSIKTLADIHASSLLYENHIGQSLDQILPEEILRPWFSEIDDYPGYKENVTSAKLMVKVIDKYFDSYPENVRNFIKQLCWDFSKNTGKKSYKYRNVLTHLDLWCNNLMFCYDQDDKVKDAIIIDFQMYGYNPPSLDLLIMIYSTTDKVTRDKYMDDLLKYYYKCLSVNIKNHGVNPDSIITLAEFIASLEETQPTALTAGVLFVNTTAMPEHEMSPIIKDIERFKVFMEKDRNIVLDLLSKYGDYKIRVLDSVQELLDFVCKNKCV